MSKPIHKPFLASIVVLVVGGLFIFASASLGLLARDGATFTSVAFNQIVFGIIGGSIACIITSRVPYRRWRPYSFYIFIIAIALNILVLISWGGSKSWRSHTMARCGGGLVSTG